MRKLAIVESLGRTVNRVGFKLKKHSPEILVVTGIVGAVASAVMACKAKIGMILLVQKALLSIRKQTMLLIPRTSSIRRLAKWKK